MSTDTSRSVKVTYLDRTKTRRNRPSTEAAQEPDSDTNSEAPSSHGTRTKAPKTTKEDVRKTPGRPKTKGIEAPAVKPPSGVRSSSRKPPLQVAVHDLPGPVPSKRSRRDSQMNSNTSKPTLTPQPTQTPGRSAPSIASRKSRSASKPRSANGNRPSKPASIKNQSVRSGRDECEDDEEGGSIADSVAESMVSGRITRTIKDRQEYYSNQPECVAFGPYCALCSRCKKYVNLSKHQTYAVGPWEKHRAKCDEQLASDERLPQNAEEYVNRTASEIFASTPVRRNATERKEFLMADEFAEVVEESRVKCRTCSKWVALRKQQNYDLHNWKNHRDKCRRRSLPSERVTMMGRKLAIVNDPQVKSFDATSIECLKCEQKVVSASGKEYDVDAWESHKESCVTETQSKSEAETNSVPFPSSAPEPPAPSLPPATEPVPPTTDKPIEDDAGRAPKRPREDEAEQPTGSEEMREEERPANRPRKESALDWLMLPFRSFVRGFRDSLTVDARDKP